MHEFQPRRGVLITGCSSGIGKHCAIRLKELGYDVVATARQTDKLQDLKSRGIHVLTLDVCEDAHIEHAIAYFKDHAIPLYALINNAGFGQPGAIEDLDRATIAAQFNTNVYSPMVLIQKALPLMRQQGYGRIIQISSVLGFVSMRFRGAYNASKYALEGLTDTLRLELRNSPIKVVLIQPGPIDSEFRRHARERFLSKIDTVNSPHQRAYQALEAQMTLFEKPSLFTKSPEAVFQAIRHALESSSPKVRYRVTFPTHLFAVLKRCLPDKWLDALMARL